MPNAPKTPNRNAGRINGWTWAAAAVIAEWNGEHRSAVITRKLDDYVRENLDAMQPAHRAHAIALIETATGIAANEDAQTA